jgi:hypothetical protein
VSNSGQLLMPVYLDAMGSSAIILPLRGLTLQGNLTSDRSCIGTYNAGGLDPVNSCQPDSTNHAFLSDGTGTAYISLEEADMVTIAAVSETLCVLLSGDPATYGISMGGVTVCKRDSSSNIVLQGDWCSTTDAAAANGCADAMRVSFSYAAGSVHFTP